MKEPSELSMPDALSNNGYTPVLRTTSNMSTSTSDYIWEDEQKTKPRTYISRLVVTLRDCLAQLQARDVTDVKLESMSVIVHEFMSSGSRNYHSVQHVFDISKNLTHPIAIIAAIFHDSIYYNVDGGLSPLQLKILDGIFNEYDEEDVSARLGTVRGRGNEDADCDNDGKIPSSSSRSSSTKPAKRSGHVVKPYEQRKRLSAFKTHEDWCVAHRDDSCTEDPMLCMVERIFGYAKDTEITTKNGINEFLSAVVAIRQLEDHLSKEKLAQIACCIEATIPFNNSTPEHPYNTAHMERLYQNMINARDHFQLKLTDQELVEAVQLAATLANEDIGNFGTDDRYHFLDNTWSLLPETNTSLRQQFLYTITEYQTAVFKMHGFFNFLDPNVILAAFRGVPDAGHISKWTEQAKLNLELGRKYVGAKLLSASVLAAFAQLTGGDAPMCLFMGDLPSRHYHSEKLEDSLPLENVSSLQMIGHCDLLVYKLLRGGRRSESSFDTKQSPLAAYLYAKLGDEQLLSILENTTMYPLNRDDLARALLQKLPRESVQFLGQIMATIAVSRSNAIQQLLETL